MDKKPGTKDAAGWLKGNHGWEARFVKWQEQEKRRIFILAKLKARDQQGNIQEATKKVYEYGGNV